MLRRPFYYGLVRVGRESFAGLHQPLISKELFDQVGTVLDGRVAVRSYESRPYVFRRMVTCARCGRHLYAEVQKGLAYYRCHSDGCQGTCLRETALVRQVLDELGSFPITDAVIAQFNEFVQLERAKIAGAQETSESIARMQLGAIKDRLNRLTDAYLDAAIDRDTFEARKQLIEEERLLLQGDVQNPTAQVDRFSESAARCLELLKSLQTLDETASAERLHGTLKSAVSNCTASGKDVEITWGEPIHVLFAEEPVLVGPPTRDSYRTIRPRCRRRIRRAGVPLGIRAMKLRVKRLITFLLKSPEKEMRKDSLRVFVDRH